MASLADSGRFGAGAGSRAGPPSALHPALETMSRDELAALQLQRLRTLFTALSWVKLPAPTMEWNSLGEQKFYWLYW